MNYSRKENESDEELIYRICSEKEVIGSWQDVADILNKLLNTEYTESKFRKQYQAFNKMLSANEHKILDDDNYLNELRVQKRELEKERVKLQTEKLEYNRWLREDSRSELIEEHIIQAIKENLNKTPQPNNIPCKKESEMEIGGQLNFADCHFGKDYKIYGLFDKVINEYSPEIFYSRMENLYNKTIALVKENNLDTLHINNLGDEIDGFLRNSQLWVLRYGAIESAVLFGNYLGHWLKKLSKEVNIIYNYTMGNHDELRLLDGRKDQHKVDNASLITSNCIKLINEDNPNFTMKENKTGLIYDEIVGFNFLGIHGEVKNLADVIKEYENIYNVKIDYILAGHKHFNEYCNCGVRKGAIGVSSIVGSDDFSMSIRKSADASASFIIYDRNKGKVKDYTIVLN